MLKESRTKIDDLLGLGWRAANRLHMHFVGTSLLSTFLLAVFPGFEAAGLPRQKLGG